jgi:dihydrofolate reductase
MSQSGDSPPLRTPSSGAPDATRHTRGFRLGLIAALAANRVIGIEGRLPWRLPEDLRHFKALTLGHPVIMGRRTWESIGRPLPGRTNIVVSRQPGYAAPGAQVVTGLESAYACCDAADEVFVIGGAELYLAALPEADILELTEIQREFAGDVHFPDFERSGWNEVRRARHTASDGLRFDFVRYERRTSNAIPPE